MSSPNFGNNASKWVLLVQVDGKLPNLALMKISAYHKSLGDEVGFHTPNPDIVYASVIFKKNKHLTDGLRFLYPDAEIHVGGSGTEDYSIKLPDEIEKIQPDYSLYPEMDYSLGFTSRGCVRNCYFCIVPKKEGDYQPWQHPSHWVIHKKAKLLDNNWYANRSWFLETSEWFIQNKVAVDVTQGMDIRLLDHEIATQLKRLSWFAPMHFAFDSLKYQSEVLHGVQILKDVGIDLRHKVFFYVYCHDDSHYEDAVFRCRELKDAGTSAFVMFNMDSRSTQRVRNLQRWANKPWLFWSIDIDQYDRSVA